MSFYVGIICKEDLNTAEIVAISDDRCVVVEALKAAGQPEGKSAILKTGTIDLSRIAMCEIHDEYTRRLLKDSIEAVLEERGYDVDSEQTKQMADDAADIAFDVYNSGESEEEAVRNALTDIGAV